MTFRFLFLVPRFYRVTIGVKRNSMGNHYAPEELVTHWGTSKTHNDRRATKRCTALSGNNLQTQTTESLQMVLAADNSAENPASLGV